MNLNGKEIDYFPAAVEDQLSVKPIIKNLKVGNLKHKELKNLKIYQVMQKYYIRSN